MLAYLKFRLQRLLRRYRRDLIQSRRSLAAYLDLHVWGRWRQLGIIRRFVGVWWLVMLFALIGTYAQLSHLSGFYVTAGPAAGGTFVEGLVGKVKSINPLLPDTTAAGDVSRLIFNGLTRVSPERQIQGDLAESWESNGDGSVYTFRLRKNVFWQDGKPLTSADVAFTIGLIQNPDTRSPLAASWQGIKVDAPDDLTVVFTLPGPSQGFITSTTVGIVPKHILQSTSPGDLRVANFNQHPVGTGPFMLDDVSRSGMQLDMVAFQGYFLGKPQLERFTFRLYDSVADAERGYSQRQLTSIARLSANADVSDLGRVHTWNMGLASEVGLFMKTTGILADTSLRRALAQTIDRQKVAKAAGQIIPDIVTEPILPGQVGYTAKHQVPSLDLTAANTALDAAGWTRGKDNWRSKDGKTLRLKLATSTASGYPSAVKELEQELGAVGIQLDSHVVDASELQQSYIKPRNYDLLLFGISIGADSDVYAYWHSSQAADPGLNLSQYNSHEADIVLEAGRLTSDKAIRSARYDKFLSIWSNDIPAVILYQPEYVYATRPEVRGITARKLVDPSDRFYDVQNWTVKTQPVQRVLSTVNGD